jgi:predicted nucleic acid-binding protein
MSVYALDSNIVSFYLRGNNTAHSKLAITRAKPFTPIPMA